MPGSGIPADYGGRLWSEQRRPGTCPVPCPGERHGPARPPSITLPRSLPADLEGDILYTSDDAPRGLRAGHTRTSWSRPPATPAPGTGAAGSTAARSTGAPGCPVQKNPGSPSARRRPSWICSAVLNIPSRSSAPSDSMITTGKPGTSSSIFRTRLVFSLTGWERANPSRWPGWNIDTRHCFYCIQCCSMAFYCLTDGTSVAHRLGARPTRSMTVG